MQCTLITSDKSALLFVTLYTRPTSSRQSSKPEAVNHMWACMSAGTMCLV